MFRQYAEKIDFTPGAAYDVATSASETIKVLSAAAKEHGVWLVGGQSSTTITTFGLK